jgi:CubicO group peptidase (beta-lactamase class C family)
MSLFAAAVVLTGLWTARRDFGPAARGPLRIDHGQAEIAGRTAPVTADGARVSFALPNDEGSFRGSVRGDRIAGYWIQASGASFGMRYATPVTLARRGPARWGGTVAPLDDHMTLFLSVAANDDVFLRNPERNVARFLGIRRISFDGTRVKLLGANDSVVAEGTYDKESDTMAIGIAAAGGTFDFHRATAADEAAFYPRSKTAKLYVYRRPSRRDDGWTVATLDDVGIDHRRIEAFIEKVIATPIDSTHASDIHGVLIARHGKLVLEEYFHGTSPDEPHDTRSASKSLTSVLVGAAKLDPSTPVYAAMNVRTDDPRKKAMTLEHLLTMSSGLDCDDNDDNSPGNEDVMQTQTAQPDWFRYTLDLKNIRNPGEKSVYCSCQSNLAGGVLARKTGRWLPDLFRDLVAEPLQIERYAIDLTPTGEGYMGGGIRFLPRDFMKLGQMMLDGGRWHGRRIVRAEWVRHSTSQRTKIGDSLYGDLWWLQDYPYKGRTVHAFFAAGNGGQLVVAVPALDLVIAFYGGNYAERAALIPGQVLIPQEILPAVN